MNHKCFPRPNIHVLKQWVNREEVLCVNCQKVWQRTKRHRLGLKKNGSM